ncbi:MAG: hypothetical protein IJ424_07235 [Oscillospiraceae bacterium]|nr:hypothetical protein [Oscillospiraceae bacterium]
MTEKQTYAASWLNSAYMLSQKIEALKEEKLRVSTYFNGIVFTRVNDPSPKTWARLSQINSQIEKEAEALDRKWLSVKQVIESVPQKHYALLSYRYLSMLSWQTIEDMLYISTSTRKRQHLAALDAVSQILDLHDPLQPR